MSLEKQFKSERDYKEKKLQEHYEKQKWENDNNTNMYHDLDIRILNDSEVPLISILIPTYNRR